MKKGARWRAKTLEKYGTNGDWKTSEESGENTLLQLVISTGLNIHLNSIDGDVLVPTTITG